MKKDVFDYKLTREEQLIAHAIKYAVAVDGEMAARFERVISPLLICTDFTTRRSKQVEYYREIDFPGLLLLTERAVEMCYTELVRLNSVQDTPMPELAQGVEMVRQLNVKGVLQNAGIEFYDFLVDLCKRK